MDRPGRKNQEHQNQEIYEILKLRNILLSNVNESDISSSSRGFRQSSSKHRKIVDLCLDLRLVISRANEDL